MDKDIKLNRVCAGVGLAAVLWFVMFSPWTAPYINFWWMMTGSALLLTSFSLWADRTVLKELRFGSKQVAAGLAIAFVLWWVFWIGDKLSQLMFSFARPQVDMIYAMREGSDSTVARLCAAQADGAVQSECWFCGGNGVLHAGACVVV